MSRQIKKNVKIYGPIYGLISLLALIISLYYKFIKKNDPKRYMYIVGYITSLIFGLIFLDKNLSPDNTMSQISEEDPDLEMEVDDLD